MDKALKEIKKTLNDVALKVSKDFGKVKVKYREGKVVKKARSDLSKGLNDLAKELKKGAKKVKGK